MKGTDLQFGADTFVHLQKLTIPSHPQGLQGLLPPWEPVQDPHTMRRRLLKFLLCHLCAAEVWRRQCKLERFQCAWLDTTMLFLFGCCQWRHRRFVFRSEDVRSDLIFKHLWGIGRHSPSSTTWVFVLSSDPATGKRCEGSRTTPRMFGWPRQGWQWKRNQSYITISVHTSCSSSLLAIIWKHTIH